MWGAIWENFVVAQIRARLLDIARAPAIWFWRTAAGDEVDLLVETGPGRFAAFECKTAERVGAEDVFAPGSALRAAVTPSGRGQGAASKPRAEQGGAPKALRTTWMQRLKHVFAIEIETCQRCGGKLDHRWCAFAPRAHKATASK